MQQLYTSIDAAEAAEASIKAAATAFPMVFPLWDDRDGLDVNDLDSLVQQESAIIVVSPPPSTHPPTAAQVEKLTREADVLTKRFQQELPAFARTAPYIQAEKELAKSDWALSSLFDRSDLPKLPDDQAINSEQIKLETLSQLPPTVSGVESITRQLNDLVDHIDQEAPGRTGYPASLPPASSTEEESEKAGTLAPTSSPGGQPITTVKGHRHTTTYFSPNCPAKILKASLGEAQLAGSTIEDVQGVPHYTSSGYIGTLNIKV